MTVRRARLAAATFATAAALCAPAAASAGWTEPFPGPLNVDAASTATRTQVTDVGGVPYVVWNELDPMGYAIHVARLTSTGWALVGAPLKMDPSSSAYAPAIANVGGVPYVIWNEPASGSVMQVWAARLEGGTWTPVGGMLNADPARDADNASLAAVGGVPYAAFEEVSSTAPHQPVIRVARLDGGSWTAVGADITLDPSAHAQVGLQAIADIGGVPYVAYRQDAGSGSHVIVERFSGGVWEVVGSQLSADPSGIAGPPALAGIAGIPYVAWTEFPSATATNVQAHVARFDGSSWTVTPSLNADPAGRAAWPVLSSIAGVPHLGFSESDGSAHQVRIERLTAGTWTALGGSLNPDPGRDATLMGLSDENGTPYATLVQSTTGPGHVHVLRYDADSTAATPTATTTPGTTPTGTTPTHTTPQTTAIIPPLRVSIATRRARVSRTGRAHVRLACATRTPAGSCAGTLSLTITVHVHKKVKGKRRTVARRVTLAKARYRAATGGSTTVSLHLTRSARRRLAHAKMGTLHTRARATLSGGSSATHSVTLLATPKLHRKATG